MTPSWCVGLSPVWRMREPVAQQIPISHPPSMREAVTRVIEEVLRPLLKGDDSTIELLDVSEGEVVVQVSGHAAFGVGAEYVRTGVIEPALRKVVGDACEIRVEKAMPLGRKEPR